MYTQNNNKKTKTGAVLKFFRLWIGTIDHKTDATGQRCLPQSVNTVQLYVMLEIPADLDVVVTTRVL